MLIIYSVESLTNIALKLALILSFKVSLFFNLFLIKVLPREATFLFANLIARKA
jgi:hypothetical protein